MSSRGVVHLKTMETHNGKDKFTYYQPTKVFSLLCIIGTTSPEKMFSPF